jgi:hypothetical protein
MDEAAAEGGADGRSFLGGGGAHDEREGSRKWRSGEPVTYF